MVFIAKQEQNTYLNHEDDNLAFLEVLSSSQLKNIINENDRELVFTPSYLAQLYDFQNYNSRPNVLDDKFYYLTSPFTKQDNYNRFEGYSRDLKMKGDYGLDLYLVYKK